MSTYNSNENPTPATGVVGTVLGGAALAAVSGLFGGNGIGLFGNNSSAQNELCQLRMQNAILASENSTDKKLVEVYTELRKQDKTQDQNLANLNSRVLALETAGPLKEQIFDGKIAQVYDKITCCCNASTTAMTALQAEISALQNLTKTVIPIDNVCPQPMQRYNSWTAPTTPANAG